MVVQS